MVSPSYGQNDLSDKIKQNVRNADMEEKLQTIFDRAAPKRYDRTDVDWKVRLGFLAQDLQSGGITGKTMWKGQELLTLDYGKLTAMLWEVCKRLQALAFGLTLGGLGLGEVQLLRIRVLVGPW